jgi:hydroxymethylpyrimidine pyrophosphatase-like HAD family hydrolase
VRSGIAAHVDYSCRYFLDVLPARAGKGNALEWLANRLGIPNSQILVAGDTGNDIPMFLLKDVKGIIVQNALPELSGVLAGRNFFRAQFCGPEGVVEGLRHFGVMKAVDLQVCKPNIVRALRWLP